jgi:hypothetical protein
MISLPIPHGSGTVRFGELHHRGLDIGKLVSDLTRKPGLVSSPTHLDPDLDRTARARRRGWRPAFGQDSAAQRHLERQGVGVGDLFLFFGWFRDVEQSGGKYRYVGGTRDRHVIFGWLRVGQVLRVGPDAVPEWLRDHPHAVRDDAPFNTIYLADGPGGGGVFPTFCSELQLTEAGEKRRSRWHLPSDFHPGARTPLTYHGSKSRWEADGDRCRLQSVAKGQEFVIDLSQYPGVQRWAEALLPADARR